VLAGFQNNVTGLLSDDVFFVEVYELATHPVNLECQDSISARDPCQD
jgi:hypothetical protein